MDRLLPSRRSCYEAPDRTQHLITTVIGADIGKECFTSSVRYRREDCLPHQTVTGVIEALSQAEASAGR
jgi:hypothetical protein